MSTHAFLLSFCPPEVLRKITNFLEADSIFRLKHTGSSQLVRCLANGGVEQLFFTAQREGAPLPSGLDQFLGLRVCVLRQGLGTISVSRRLSFAPGLRELILEFRGGLFCAYHLIVAGDLPHLSKLCAWHTNQELDLEPMFNALPHLVHLEMSGFPRLMCPSHLPRSLTFLAIADVAYPNWNFQVPYGGLPPAIETLGINTPPSLTFELPPSLTRLQFPVISFSRLPLFPKTITDLGLVADFPARDLLPFLPPSLQRLHVHQFTAQNLNFPNLTAEEAMKLPITLTSTNLLLNPLLDPLTLEVMKTIPMVLVHATCYRMPQLGNIVHVLPDSIQELSLKTLPKEGKWPRGVTKLSVMIVEDSSDALPETLRDLKIASLGPISSLKLPRSLTKLSIDLMGSFAPLENLPESLERLEIETVSSALEFDPDLRSEIFNNLPRKLTDLRIAFNLNTLKRTRDQLKSLPGTLRELNLVRVEVQDLRILLRSLPLLSRMTVGVFSHRVEVWKEFVPLEHLVELLRLEVVIHGMSAGVTTSIMQHLPPNVESVQIHGNTTPYDTASWECLEELPVQLKRLILHCKPGIPPNIARITHIPAHLSTLEGLVGEKWTSIRDQ